MSRKLKPVGPKLGVQDGDPSIGQNINPYLPGTGWVVQFAAADFTLPETEYEVWHISLDGPVGSSAVVFIDQIAWDYVLTAWSNAWDPAQPMFLRSGQAVSFCWNFPFTAPPYNRTSNVQPQVTLWTQQPSETRRPW